MPVELSVVESVTELETTVVTIVLDSSSAPGIPGVGVPAGGTANQVLTKDSGTDYDTSWQDAQGAGGGAPDDVDYLVGTASGDLSAEIVVGTSPGGELGGTWASPTVDASHSGSTHAAVQAAAEATAAAALAGHTGDTTDAHDASAISVDSTNLAGTGTDVQAVLEELDDAIAAVDAGDVPSTRTLTAGAGLAGGGDLSADRSFAVNVDDSSIEINADTLRVKAGGITSAMIADGTVAVGDLAFDPATQAELDAHVNDTTDAHAGSAITNTAAGNISATTVQAAINELDTEKQPLDADLTAIAALSPSNDDIIQRKGGVWTNRTIAQLLTDLATPGTTFQPLDSDLTAIAALSTTAFGRAVLALADAAALATAAGVGTADSPQFTAVNVGHASDTTLARSGSGELTVEGNRIFRVGGADVPLADGGTGASLADPNADRIMFWDDSGSAVDWLAAGTGLSISGTTISATATMAKLDDQTLGSDTASIDTNTNGALSGAYDVLEVWVLTRTTEAVVGSSLVLRFNNDSGANYDIVLVRDVNATVSGANTLAGTSILLPSYGANAQTGAVTLNRFTIPGYAQTTFHKVIEVTSEQVEDTAADARVQLSGARWRSTSAITRIAVTAGSGNLLTGSRLIVYGR